MRKRRSYEIRGARPTRCGAAKPLIMAALADAEGAHDSNHHLQCTAQAQPWQVPENGKNPWKMQNGVLNTRRRMLHSVMPTSPNGRVLEGLRLLPSPSPPTTRLALSNTDSLSLLHVTLRAAGVETRCNLQLSTPNNPHELHALR